MTSDGALVLSTLAWVSVLVAFLLSQVPNLWACPRVTFRTSPLMVVLSINRPISFDEVKIVD